MRIYIHTFIHKYIHAYTHTHTHTQTHTRARTRTGLGRGVGCTDDAVSKSKSPRQILKSLFGGDNRRLTSTTVTTTDAQSKATADVLSNMTTADVLSNITTADVLSNTAPGKAQGKFSGDFL